MLPDRGEPEPGAESVCTGSLHFPSFGLVELAIVDLEIGLAAEEKRRRHVGA